VILLGGKGEAEGDTGGRAQTATAGARSNARTKAAAQEQDDRFGGITDDDVPF
jgi:hypothetical protein